MHKSFKNFLLLLAGSGLSQSEIRRVLSELQHLPPSVLAETIQYLRKNAQYSLDDVAESLLGTPYKRQLRNDRAHLHDIASRVESMLRGDAGLTVKVSVQELMEVIGAEYPSLHETLRPPRRESFYDWLCKVSEQIGPRKLLHFAARVRKAHMQDSNTDWELKE